MKIRFGVYETPQPDNSGRPPRLHARVISKGTMRMDDLCAELRDLGVNSAQIKAVLDAAGKFIGKSLTNGYHVELEEIGTFSLSLRSNQVEEIQDDSGEEEYPEGILTQVAIDRINFRGNPKLLKHIRQSASLEKVSTPLFSASLKKRKARMLSYLQEQGYISGLKYAEINNCSRYQSKKDLSGFEAEGLIQAKGKGSHRVYVLG
ncbi:hypothetical protein D0T51_11490 [Parabacteroides sp. 52]|uniref:HU family DNA-binding protein n=1 Tax=unclassified Parabacteroides TaxID=2649774 RepID=UPI0013D02666|nr:MULTISPECIES: hypothetical protein [unclassified Parabacteroides]MDH6535699.1 putative histone-like DNA-binding protein [Parabacteroides sp. PM5-20]NDV56348.1 hypothetical protein [Parabacteroides sp. 52]